jgi:hypothetical protein
MPAHELTWEKPLIPRGKRWRARIPESLKESNNFLHARAIHHAILMTYKTRYETIQTQYTIRRRGARHSHSSGEWQAPQRRSL